MIGSFENGVERLLENPKELGWSFGSQIGKTERSFESLGRLGGTGSGKLIGIGGALAVCKGLWGLVVKNENSVGERREFGVWDWQSVRSDLKYKEEQTAFGNYLALEHFGPFEGGCMA